MSIYITLGLCVAGAALLVCRYDMYDREPWYMLLLGGVAGALAMWGLAYVEDASIDLWGVNPPAWVLAAVASSHEEAARFAIVLSIALITRRHFNDPMDGIIYGSIVGVGMAASESVSVLRGTPELASLPPVEFVRLYSHLVLGGVSGFAVGVRERRRACRRRWALPLAASLGASLSIHFLWDWLVLGSTREGALGALRTAGVIALLLSGTILYGVLVKIASNWSRIRHAPVTQRELSRSTT